MDVREFLHSVYQEDWYDDQVVHTELLPSRASRYAELEEPLPEILVDALEAQGITRLYLHQAQAINHIRRGGDVVVATGTASGKTLCYNVPVLERILDDWRTRALYLYPTKALAQDQLRALGELTKHGWLQRVLFDTYDGDTPTDERGRIRRDARIILSNPDMLHVGILPNHANWAQFFANLTFVVIDEAHVYRGVFGSHVACVLRRLWRVCEIYGSPPTVIAASATIGNPGEHVERLAARPTDSVRVIDEDGGPSGHRTFVLWNPPCANDACDARRSPNSEATELMAALVSRALRPIVFTQARKVAELILRYVRDRLARIDETLPDKIAAYRAGYLPAERRDIERRLFAGELLGVTATNALELGIDVGVLDAAVLVGFPGTIASTWQQAGRAGRGSQNALAVLIAQDNPLDQYLMRHPEAVFGRPIEEALIDPQNYYVLRDHLPCAAYEKPLDIIDRDLFGDVLDETASTLLHLGVLEERRGRLFYVGDGYPAQQVSIRSTGGLPYSLRVEGEDGPELLETIEAATVLERAHPGAIYLHQGESYLVEELDIDNRVAWLRPVDANYYTRPRVATDVRLERRWASREVGATEAFVGEVSITQQVIGFRRLRQYTDELVSEEWLDVPSDQFETVGVWWTVPAAWARQFAENGLDFEGGLHAAEHAAIGLLPLFAMCDRWDIGGVSTALHPDTGTPVICIYDGHPGGVGIAEHGYTVLMDLWTATLDTLYTCSCDDGCPACVQSPKCGNNNMTLDKHAAVALLELLLQR